MKEKNCSITLYYKVLFMNNENPTSATSPAAQSEPLREISDIKRIMERSSRFISLSGLSGIAAGLCGLAGSYAAHRAIENFYHHNDQDLLITADTETLVQRLLLIASAVLGLALLLAFLFTWRRAKKNHLPVWDLTSKKLLLNLLIPLIAGGLFILALLQSHDWQFVSPACLIFYGLALVNGSKYTLTDIRYLGYLEILLGLVNTQYPGYSLYFWAGGFGLLHIVYGTIMWWKYEKSMIGG